MMSGIATQRESSFLWLNTACKDRMTSVCKAYDEVLRQMVGRKVHVTAQGSGLSEASVDLTIHRTYCISWTRLAFAERLAYHLWSLYLVAQL